MRMVPRCFSLRPRVFHQTPCFPQDPVFSIPRDPGPAFSTYPAKDSAREKRAKGQKKGDSWQEDSFKLESIFLSQYHLSRFLFPTDKQSCKLQVFRVQGSKLYLRRIRCWKQRLFFYTEMRPLGSWHEDSCSCSTGAEQCIQSGSRAHRGYRCYCHNDRAFSLYRIHPQCNLNWFGYGQICPVYQCEFHLRISWP